MRPLRLHFLVAVLALGVAGAACGGQNVDLASPTRSASVTPSSVAPTPSEPSPSPSSPSPTPTPALQIELPRDAPRTFARDLSADRVPVRRLVPPHAQVVSAWRLGPPDVRVAQIGLAWRRGNVFTAQQGFQLWQAFAEGPAWRVVYAFTDEPSAGVLGVRFETGDLTGDGAPDVLTFEDLGGSGACGVWRVVTPGPGSATEIYRKQTCDTDVRISGGDLAMREALFAPGDAHCCPSRYRTTTLAWDGTTWGVVDEVVEKA